MFKDYPKHMYPTFEKASVLNRIYAEVKGLQAYAFPTKVQWDESQRVYAGPPAPPSAILPKQEQKRGRTWVDPDGTYMMVRYCIGTEGLGIYAGRFPGLGPVRLTHELDAIQSFGITDVVCLVPECDITDPDFYDLAAYMTEVRARFGSNFHLVEVVDYSTPAQDSVFEAAVETIIGRLKTGAKVLVHCGAGCGRAGMFASCLAVHEGEDPVDAIARYFKTRGCGPETSEQLAYPVWYSRRGPERPALLERQQGDVE